MPSDLPPALVREIVDGDLEDDPTLHRHTGRVGPELGRILSFREHAWQQADDDRVSWQESARFQEAVPLRYTERMTRGIEDGNQSLLGFGTGVVDQSVDARKAKELSKLFGLVRNAGSLLNFCGGTDNGKSNVMWLTAEIFCDVLDDALVVGNVSEDSLDLPPTMEYREVSDMDELERLVRAESDRPKLVFVDDASIDHSAHSADSQEVSRRQGKLARLAAKLDARVLFIGHRDDGLDLAKHIRAMPGTRHLQCVRIDEDDGTTDRFVATVYDDLDEDGLADVHLTLDPLPETDVGYDPDDVAHALFAEG